MITALGSNAFVEFDGREVTLERRDGGWSPTPARMTYPLQYLTGIIASVPDLEDGGTFTLSLVPGTGLYPPMVVQYPGFRVREFSALMDSIMQTAYDLGRPMLVIQPQPVLPATIAQITAGPSSPDLASQIASLAAHHRDGNLTAAEFAAAKARLLGLAPGGPTDQAA